MSFSARRIAAGLTLDDVAREFHVPPDEVRAWEQGTATPPENVARSLAVMERFAASSASEAALVRPSNDVQDAPPPPRRKGREPAGIKPRQPEFEATRDEGPLFAPGKLIKSKKR